MPCSCPPKTPATEIGIPRPGAFDPAAFERAIADLLAACGIAADAAIVCEPSNNNVFTATPGDVYWGVTVNGRPRSPGARWKNREQEGISAIEKLPPVIEGLLNLEKDYNRRAPDPLYADNHAFSCVIGEIGGGSYATVTAGECTVRGPAMIEIGSYYIDQVGS